jgi:hypothetical protein
MWAAQHGSAARSADNPTYVALCCKGYALSPQIRSATTFADLLSDSWIQWA